MKPEDAVEPMDAPVPPEAVADQELPSAPTATPSILRAATTSAASFLGGVKIKAAELQQQVSARMARPPAPEAPAPGATLPPAILEEDQKQSTSATQVANSLMEAAAGLSRKTRESSSQAYQAAVQGLRRLTAPTRKVAAVCKADLRTKPCPQVLLLCCNWVATSGLTCSTLFQEPLPPQAQVEALAAKLEDHLVLLPPDLDPALAAATITHFLSSLEEPLLTFRLSAAWVAAGKALADGDIGAVGAVLEDLPLVNWSTLKLLVEMCYRVASQFNVTGMNALALATVLAPALLWNEQATPSSAQAMASQASHMAGMAAASFHALRSKLAPSTLPAGEVAAAPTTDTGSPSAVAAAAAADIAVDGAPSLPVSDASAKAPKMVLDEDEELAGDAAFLEQRLSQQGKSAGGGVAQVQRGRVRGRRAAEGGAGGGGSGWCHCGH